jgi:hypothetical protein
MKIEQVNIQDIKLNPSNPRTIKDEKFKQLVQSIKSFPKMLEIRPIVVNDDMVVLGGNMRLSACIEAKMKKVFIIRASNLSAEEQREFIIKDNVGFGDWEWQMLANEWNVDELKEWGLDVEAGTELSDEFGEDFTLKDGDKEPFQQMTFTLADEQATVIKNAIDEIKGTQEYRYCETFGNENSNGNALYLIVMQWAEQRK